MLDPHNHQGKFAEDYVRVLASAAGLVVHQEDLDQDGIDLGFRLPGKPRNVSSPMIEVQIKSVSNPRCSGGDLLYDGLDQVQYNQLADGPFMVPRYLVVVVVPPVAEQYARFETDGVLLRQLGFFRGFDGEPAIAAPDRRRHHRVRVPLANVLTVRALKDLVVAAEAPVSAAAPPA
jgi:Domain of unknown function (DUF4365)